MRHFLTISFFTIVIVILSIVCQSKSATTTIKPVLTTELDVTGAGTKIYMTVGTAPLNTTVTNKTTGVSTTYDVVLYSDSLGVIKVLFKDGVVKTLDMH